MHQAEVHRGPVNAIQAFETRGSFFSSLPLEKQDSGVSAQFCPVCLLPVHLGSTFRSHRAGVWQCQKLLWMCRYVSSFIQAPCAARCPAHVLCAHLYIAVRSPVQSVTQIPFHNRALTHTHPGRFSCTCSSLCVLHSGLKQSVGASPSTSFWICLSFLSFLARSLGIFIGPVFNQESFLFLISWGDST